LSIPSLHRKFTHAIAWNALEAIPYQLILALHNMALFAIIGAQAYGQIGTLFSFIFLAVGLANLGFDAALPLFFADAQISKTHYKKIIGYHYMPTLCALALLVIVLPFLLKMGHLLTPSLSVLCLSALIVVETLKKGARTLLHGAFYNQQTALIELFQVVIYVLLVWTAYWSGQPLDTIRICGTLLCVSTLCLSMLSYYVYRFYDSLPDQAPISNMPVIAYSVVRQRSYTTIISLSHQFFSSNALVPLFAYTFGLAAAGMLKLVGTIAHGALICIQKIFCSSSDALFAQLKYDKLHDKQQAFFFVTNHLHATLYGIILFTIFLMSWLYTSNKSILYDTSFMYALLCLILYVSEQFFSTYERFFIAQHRTGQLMLFTIFTLTSLYAIIWYVPASNPVTMLQLVLCVRIISGILLSGCAWLWWGIRPQAQVNLFYLFGTLAISCICFLIIK